MADTAHQLLKPEILASVKSLELKARQVIHGLYDGMHRSPFFGVGVEYADHRSYNPGDEPRHIDWKLYMRTDRLYIKRFEVERDLTCRILLDTSGSMGFESEWGTKMDYARLLTATLSHLVNKQHDLIGLSMISSGVTATVPPRNGSRHLRGLLAQLVATPAHGETNLRAACLEAAQRSSRRGLVVIISDFLDDIDSILDGIGHLQARRQDVVCFHVLDRYERELPFKFLSNFVDPETGRTVVADPLPVRQQYITRLNEFIEELKEGCWRRNVDYVPLDTAVSLQTPLTDYLRRRQRGGPQR